MGASAPKPPPLILFQCLRAEYAKLRPEWFAPEPVQTSPDGTVAPAGPQTPSADEELTQLFRKAHRPPKGRPLSALCFSGGGIRSATFNLGVLQGLAERGLLDQFDYLSSVSGGGYIAGWLSGWLHHTDCDLEAVRRELSGPQKAHPLHPEPRQIVHLRAYGNYLTPRVGALSVDGWTVLMIVLRNLVLNWFVLVPVFAAVLALPLLAVAEIEPPFASWLRLLFWAGLGFEGLGIMFMFALRGNASRELPVRGAGADRPRKRREHFVFFGLVPLLIGATFLVTATSADVANWTDAFRVGVPIGLIVPVLAFAVSLPAQKTLARRADAKLPAAALSDFLALTASGAIATVLYAFLLVNRESLLPSVPYAWAMLGLAFLFLPMLLGNALFVAFASWAEGRTRESEFGDAQREWWARWSAWVAIAVLTWTLASALVYLTPVVLTRASDAIVAFLGTLTLGQIISKLGTSALTPAKDGRRNVSWTQWAITLGVPVFCLLLAMVISYVTQTVAGRVLGIHVGQAPLIAPPADIGMIIAVLGVIGLTIGAFVNVNRFSLHALYRNRLVRAYLGASNPDRTPNFFTGFDPHDNIRMADLEKNRPLPVVNMCLNLVHGDNLAWQQRKAESFTATPLHCGSASLGYRPTEEYGGPQGISLGTAVAISGAAANPNMGYNSSPAVTLVMSFFNARLGAWLGNPGRNGERSYQKSGPRLSSIYYLFAEAFGWTDGRRAYVDLSDGGHFENLGLYEMVRRRCRFIVVSDAGQDKSCHFGDLGNAIRKIRIDLGIPIEFKQPIRIFPKVDNAKDLDPMAGYCAIGEIHYGDIDPGAPSGTLLYIKPAICDIEAYDVYNYARTSADFPHETTADQWFSESQFESYRALGKTTLLTISEPMPTAAAADADRLRLFFEAADAYLQAKRDEAPEPQALPEWPAA